MTDGETCSFGVLFSFPLLKIQMNWELWEQLLDRKRNWCVRNSESNKLILIHFWCLMEFLKGETWAVGGVIRRRNGVSKIKAVSSRLWRNELDFNCTDQRSSKVEKCFYKAQLVNIIEHRSKEKTSLKCDRAGLWKVVISLAYYTTKSINLPPHSFAPPPSSPRSPHKEWYF